MIDTLSKDSPSKTILITGSTGLLGLRLAVYLESKGFCVLRHSKSSGQNTNFVCNLLDLTSLRAMIKCLQPDIIINLVALTSVEQCEIFPNDAYLTNAKTIENIVKIVKDLCLSTRILHISTDQLYDGYGASLEGQVVLKNYYAYSKFLGEQSIGDLNGVVLRTNFVGKSMKSERESLTDWLFRSLNMGNKIQVLSDVFFSPLSISTLCEMIELVVNSKISSGIFNLGSKDGMSKAEFDFLFAEYLALDSKCMSLVDSSKANFLRAYRPKDMRMDCNLFQNTFSVELPTLRQEIEKVAKEYQ